MADGGELIEAILVAIMGTAVSVFLIRFGGEVLDRLLAGLISSGMYEVSATWQTGSQESLVNLFYIVCALPCILGLIVAYLMTQRRTEIDTGQHISEGDFFQ